MSATHRISFVAVASAYLGCASAPGLPFVAKPDPMGSSNQPMAPHEAEYELLASTTAQACASIGDFRYFEGVKSPDPFAVTPAFLYEEAKYNAIGKIAGADVLVATRAKSTIDNGQTCVTVTGRAARVLSLRSGAWSARDDQQVERKRSMEKVLDRAIDELGPRK